MQCPSCQRQNPSDNQFCGGCGSPLALRCPGCARENPPDHAFCGGCGHPLAAGASAAAPASGSPPSSGSAAGSASVTLPAGFAQGRYTLVRPLGEGSRKRVYLARDERLGREVAVAVIKAEGLDEAGRARVRREAEALGQLGDHPNVVTVHDVVDDDGQIQIVGQYLGGGDLEGLLRASEGQRLPLPDVLRIGEQVALALAHAHERGIVHRDLKPANIWLTEDGTAKLGDFGLAVALDRSRLSSEGMLVGTVAYMPPEQALGRPPDARSDLYALGATLYEMATGRPPFVGDDIVAIISQHINTSPVAPSWHNPEVHAPFEALILRLLAKDPGERPQTAAEVAAALRRLAEIPEGGSAVDTPSPAGEANRLDRLADGVFVGRDAELQALRTGLDKALAGRGHVLMLVGEPGIGKTRTSQELATYAQMRGAQVLWGRCYEGEGAPAYWPWVQIVRAYVHDAEPKELASEMGPGAVDIAAVVSDVRECLPGLPEAPTLEPDQARFRLFDSINIFLRNASRRTPLLLVLDDLHWADRSSLLLLEFVARELSQSRILILGSYRDVELGRQHPLEQTLAELAQRQLSDRVLLRGLQPQDVARYIAQTAHIDPPQTLVDAVYRETEGNPFFISEVVRLLESDRRLQDVGRVETWSLDVPQGVRQVLGRRLSTLSESCNGVLSVASVIGREFDVEVLAACTDAERDEVLAALDEALAARLIEEEQQDSAGPGTRYRFSHALVEQTLYEEISGPRRVPLHRRVGQTLEKLHADKPGPHLGQIARHYFRAVQVDSIERSVHASKRAADWATTQLAHDEAAGHVDRAIQAIELSETPDARERGELLVELARLRWLEGDLSAARSAATRALPLAREVGDGELLARAVLQYGGPFPMFEMGRVDAKMVSLLDEALEAVGDEDTPLRASLLTRMANEHVFEMEGSRLGEFYDEGLASARRSGDPLTLCRALLANPGGQIDHLDRWEAFAGESLEVAEAAGLRAEVQMAYAVSIALAVVRGDPATVRKWLAREREIAAELRSATAAYFVVLHDTMLALLEGRFEAADELSREAIAIGERVFDHNAVQWFGAQRSLLAQQTLEEIPKNARGTEQLVERFPAYPVYRCGLISHYALSGNLDGARAQLDIVAAKDFRDFPRDGNYLVSLRWVTDGIVALHDRERAQAAYDALLPYRALCAWVGLGACYFGTTERTLGRLARALGRFDVAQEHLERAAEHEAAAGAVALLVEVRFDQAELLLERRAAGDVERALELLNEVLESGRKLGMKGSVKRALEAKLEAQGIDRGSTHESIYVVASTVQDAQPDLRPHAAPDGTVTIMFSDMQGFTAMTERLGDVRAHQVIQRHNAIVREQLHAFGGYEVELQGDGFLLAFSSARRALECATAIQRAFERYSSETPDEPIQVRIGLHTGEAIKDADKFFGKTVILAARIAAEAVGGEILVSSVLRQLTESGGDLRFEPAQVAELKGIATPQELHRVDWRSAAPS